MQLFFDHLDTPLGNIQICANHQAIRSIHFVEQLEPTQGNTITELAKQQLLQYFAGQRKRFDLPLQADGTAFQKRVWQALCGVEYGDTCSYKDIAQMIENPKAVRAVGAANGKNPMTIVVPCHRVVAANGALSGYASGVQRKAWLLEHEAESLF